MRVKDSLLLWAEVLTDDGDDSHLSEVTCSEREIGCSAGEAAVPASCRSFYGVKRDATNYGNCHVYFLSVFE